MIGPIKHKQVIWVSEPNACGECRERDGKVYVESMLEVLDQMPPLHPNCKCVLIDYDNYARRDWGGRHGGGGRHGDTKSGARTTRGTFQLPEKNAYYQEDVTSTIPYYEERYEPDYYPETDDYYETYPETSTVPPPSYPNEYEYYPETEDYYEPEPEPSTIPNGGVYSRGDLDDEPFTGGTSFIMRTRIEAAILATNLFIRNRFSLTGYAINKKLIFNKGYINDQDSGEAAKVQMGVHIGSNACGWVAAYNAFMSLGMKVHPADIVSYIESDNGLIAGGLLGTNPLVFDRLFKKYGLESTTTVFQGATSIVPLGLGPSTQFLISSMPQNLLPKVTDVDLDFLAEQGQTFILVFYNNKDDMGQGAHYVSVTWDKEEEEYVAWNVSKDYVDEPKTFGSIYEFLGETRELISMTVVKQR